MACSISNRASTQDVQISLNNQNSTDFLGIYSAASNSFVSLLDFRRVLRQAPNARPSLRLLVEGGSSEDSGPGLQTV